MSRKEVTLKILLVLIFSDVLETITHFCFKKSTFTYDGLGVQTLGDAFFFLRGAFSSPFLWLGLLSVLLTFIIWASILSKVDLSVAVPIASFSYILVPLVSIIFFHEKISIMRWSGILFILAGVIFVSMSSKEKEFHVT